MITMPWWAFAFLLLLAAFGLIRVIELITWRAMDRRADRAADDFDRWEQTW